MLHRKILQPAFAVSLAEFESKRTQEVGTLVRKVGLAISQKVTVLHDVP